MLALLGLGLASGILDLPAPTRIDSPITPGRVVLAASVWDPGSARPNGTEEAGVLVLALGPSPGTHDAASTAISSAADDELAAAIDAAACVELRAGTWLGWYQAAHAHRHERAWTRALRRANAAGKEVRASGAAAAWIARWSTVARAVLDKPSQDPHDGSLDLPIEGLGLLDGPLVGILGPNVPTADRIVERAVTYGYRSVLLLSGDAEVECDPRGRTARIRQRGDGVVLWIDLGAATRSRERVRGARLTLPRDGDMLDLANGGLLAQAADPNAPLPDVSATLALVARFLVSSASSASADPWELRNVRASRDEKTATTAFGGLHGVHLDFEFAGYPP